MLKRVIERCKEMLEEDRQKLSELNDSAGRNTPGGAIHQVDMSRGQEVILILIIQFVVSLSGVRTRR